MSVKTVNIEGIGEVIIAKRKGMRNMRISLSHAGQVKVSLPSWAPIRAGVEFAKSKQEWIAQNKKTKVALVHGQKIGKAHRLVFETTAGNRIITKIANGQVRVLLPPDTNWQDKESQTKATSAAVKALTQEARQLLPQRLDQLSQKYSLPYKSIDIKNLKTRWGSCSSYKDIILNCYLMQLPWELIDYVILHELTHTVVMAHGPVFWQTMASYNPNVPVLRKQMRTQHPTF